MAELGELGEELATSPLETARFTAAGRALAAREPASPTALPAAIRALTSAVGQVANLAAALEALTAGYLEELQAAHDRQARAQRYLSQTLLHQATHDPLTGLPNRTALISKLTAATEGVGVCYIDLDGFKAVNDRYGHDAGDTLLTVIAERIRRTASVHGALAARIGGDEFVVLAEQSDTETLIALVRDILDEVRQPVLMAHGEIRITACAGIAESAAAGAQRASLVADADAALYQAKAAGPGRWVIHNPAPAKTQGRTPARSMAVSIRAGLERGEFQIGYLPVVGLANGELTGVRAVPVWRHPALGELTADVFLPLAEDTSAASHLASWLLETAAADARTWPGIPVTVTLPARQPVLPAAPAAHLRVEFYETDVATPQATAQLRELRTTGARLVIAGFGSGTAGLARLRELRPDSVVLHGDVTADETLVATLTALARSFGAEVIAGGVTDATHARMLQHAGCDAAYGPLFSAPVPAARIGQLAKARATAAALAQLPAQSRPGSARKTPPTSPLHGQGQHRADHWRRRDEQTGR
jgi:diguanylate cyclase (GGDEF)-like protein